MCIYRHMTYAYRAREREQYINPDIILHLSMQRLAKASQFQLSLPKHPSNTAFLMRSSRASPVSLMCQGDVVTADQQGFTGQYTTILQGCK